MSITIVLEVQTDEETEVDSIQKLMSDFVENGAKANLETEVISILNDTNDEIYSYIGGWIDGR